MKYTFCENVWATASSPWHIRATEKISPGGTTSIKPLCGWEFKGWDLEIKIKKHLSGATSTSHICPTCLKKYQKLTA